MILDLLMIGLLGLGFGAVILFTNWCDQQIKR